jgi:DNA-binding transcriptional ArsR family regulator
LPLLHQVGAAEVADIADVFALLSDVSRLRILLVLHDGEASVSDISSRTGMTHSATSHALRLLRAHEVVQVRRAGRMAYYELADDHVRELIGSALEHSEHSQITHPERLAFHRQDVVT